MISARQRGLGLSIVSLALIGSLFLVPPVSASGTSRAWTISGMAFYNGTFQNTTLSNLTLQLTSRLPPTNRTMVLDIGPPGSADSGSVAWPSVLREANGSYRMWYTGRTSAGYSILLATSSDGTKWTKVGVVLTISSTVAVAAPNVLKIGSTYHMWFESGSSGGPLGYFDEVYHATSADGISWTVSGLALGLGPTGAWDSAIVADPHVIVDSAGLYRMYYTGFDAYGDARIGLATSRDLVTWTRYPGNPVLNFGPAGAWDNAHVGGSSVVIIGSTWVMYYAGNPNGSTSSVGRATSADGYNWTRYSGNPVVRPEPYPYWDDVNVGTPDFLIDPSGPRLYYYGYNGTTQRIGEYLFGPPPVLTYFGTYFSPVFDSGATGTTWLSLAVNASVSSGTSLGLRARAGNVSSPDTSWATWAPAAGVASLPRTRYVQVAVDLTSTAWNLTPVVTSVTLDYSTNGAPDALPEAPPASAWTNVSRPVLRWTVSDPEGDPIVAERVELGRIPDFSVIAVDSGNLTPGAASWQVPYLLQDGTWYWRVQAEDVHGAWGVWHTSQLLLDTAPPTLTISNPTAAALVHKSSLDIVWTASDDLSGIDRVSVSLDGGAPLSVGPGYSSAILGGLSDGAHTLRVTAFDRAGNGATVTLSFGVDTAVFSVTGPYGAWPVAAIIIAVAAGSSFVLLWFRRRERPPMAENKT